MRKVSFTNLGVLAAVLAMRPYGNGFEFDLDDSAVVLVDGAEVGAGRAAASPGLAATNAASAPAAPAKGDPSDLAQMLNRQPAHATFDPNSDPNRTGMRTHTHEIVFSPGMTVDLPWPQSGQEKTRVKTNGLTGKLAVRITVPRDAAVGKRTNQGFLRTAGVNDRDFIAASGLLSVPHVVNRGDQKDPAFTFTVDQGSVSPGLDTDLSGGEVVYASFDVKSANDWELDFAVPR